MHLIVFVINFSIFEWAIIPHSHLVFETEEDRHFISVEKLWLLKINNLFRFLAVG